jgi:hypothetical protein
MTHTNGICDLLDRENNTPFKRPQEDSTISNYALIAAKLILFLARDKITYELNLHEKLQFDVNNLVADLVEMHNGNQDLNTMDDLQVAQLTTDVHHIFLGLWMHRWRKTPEQQFPDPTVCYLAFGSLKKDGSFHPPKNITHTLAALCYVLRCTFKMQAIFVKIVCNCIEFSLPKLYRASTGYLLYSRSRTCLNNYLLSESTPHPRTHVYLEDTMYLHCPS